MFFGSILVAMGRFLLPEGESFLGNDRTEALPASAVWSWNNIASQSNAAEVGDFGGIDLGWGREVRPAVMAADLAHVRMGQLQKGP